MKKALITGITGQDGAYLAKFLLDKGYKVYGMYRRSSTRSFWRLEYTEVLKKVHMIPADMTDMSSLLEAVKLADPDEIYNLAAQSFVGASFDQPLYTTDVDGSGSIRMLEIIRHLNKDIKFYQASTSEMYGDSGEELQNEETKFWPNSPYAAAKVMSFHNTRIYREGYGLFACNGILFNHESPLRGLEFVTRKITNSVARIKLELQKDVKLGNLEARRDWGFAPEYVEAMWMMLQQDKAQDFVCATGETHSVKEFAEAAFSHVGLNWEDYVKVDKMFLRPKDLKYLRGDSTKLREATGWKPKIKFNQLVEKMVDSDLKHWQNHMDGKLFAWDAPHFPDDWTTINRHVSPNENKHG